MTGKLMKYEIKSSMKLMAVIWAALIAASLLFSLSLHVLTDIAVERPGGGISFAIGIFEFITGLMYFAVFVALIVATLVIVIMRFYKGLLGDEGYLMHTLPVKPWQLITSKGIIAALIVMISVLVAFLSILVLAGVSGLEMIPKVFGALGAIWEEEPRMVLVIVEAIILLVLSVLKSVYQIYAALAIGQLANKHRILLSLGAYIGISMIMSILFLLIVAASDSVGTISWLSVFIANNDSDPFAISQMAIGIMFVLTAVQLAAFHVVTERILSLKLNLQ
ncbi:MAG TPA: hypothetical protein IAD25_05265 [Candidatus Copromorpha excrementipullorum]|uniref:Uncharacterized protein n=1 Tax=Candidatus Allocopromorpha excrementipullorum TaxID=2840743 RepID=A0A9D1N6K9_9FIRM|nr:hypothetical protein [Candidatus Copromorpha excrementipullorum]